MMQSPTPPLGTGWWSIDFPPYRTDPELTTYSLWALETVPPLPPELRTGDFVWLQGQSQCSQQQEPLANMMGHDLEDDWPATDWQAAIEDLQTQAAQLGLKLPSDFSFFMASPTLKSCIRSSTDCFFNFSDQLVALTAEHNPSNEELFLIRFLSDSQDCLHWYLYLTPNGSHGILVSTLRMGGEYWSEAQRQYLTELYGEDYWTKTPDEEWDDEEPETKSNAFWYCGASFEEFIYRFWMENEIWHALSWDKVALREDQQRYADECLRPSSASKS